MLKYSSEKFLVGISLLKRACYNKKPITMGHFRHCEISIMSFNSEAKKNQVKKGQNLIIVRLDKGIFSYAHDWI